MIVLMANFPAKAKSSVRAAPTVCHQYQRDAVNEEEKRAKITGFEGGPHQYRRTNGHKRAVVEAMQIDGKYFKERGAFSRFLSKF